MRKTGASDPEPELVDCKVSRLITILTTEYLSICQCQCHPRESERLALTSIGEGINKNPDLAFPDSLSQTKRKVARLGAAARGSGRMLFGSGAYLKFSSVTHDTPFAAVAVARGTIAQVVVVGWQSGAVAIEKYFRKPSIPRSMPRRRLRPGVHLPRANHFPLGTREENKQKFPLAVAIVCYAPGRCTHDKSVSEVGVWKCSRSFQEASSSHERLGLRGKIRYVTHAART